MFFGGAGSTAAAVTTGLTAEQDNDVTRYRFFTTYVSARGGPDNGADFHAFSYIARMIVFTNFAGGKTDLVTVRAVTASGAGRNLYLR